MGVEGWEVAFRGDRLQADIAHAVLEANDIPAELFGDTPYGTLTEARVLVPAERLEEARRLLVEGLNPGPGGG